MKKMNFKNQIITLVFFLPLSVNAICFKSFALTGFGVNNQTAVTDAEDKAD